MGQGVRGCDFEPPVPLFPCYHVPPLLSSPLPLLPIPLFRLVLFNVVSMNPRTRLRAVASLEEDIVFVFAREKVYTGVDILLRTRRLFRVREKTLHALSRGRLEL